MKRALITGGAGFLGANLAKLLVKDGYQVTIIDDYSSGSLANLKAIESEVSVLEHDVRNPFPAKQLSAQDFVYHLASPASPEDYYARPLYTLETSAFGIKNALEYSAEVGAKMMFASTSEVYGDPSVHPQVETYWGNVNPVGPRSCYDEAKRYAESYLNVFRQEKNLDAKIVRIFNTYGPLMRSNDGRVVSNFIIRALKNEPLEIYGDGSQTRSFCYVTDLINGFHKMMQSDESGPINLGNPTELTIREIAEKILEKTNSKSAIEYKKLPQDDPTRRKPDISLATSKLDWEPVISLDQGLSSTIEYFASTI